MVEHHRSWWGERFLQAISRLMDEKILKKGTAFSTSHRIMSFEINENQVMAKIRGKANPYFGVYAEPHNKVKIELTPISNENWSKIITRLVSNAAWVSKLLMNEMPETIEEVFQEKQLPFLPQSSDDLRTECSCPDPHNPCVHVAGLYYRIASLLDEDPLMMFQLRGLSREKLHQELSRFPMGQVLLSQLTLPEELPLEPEQYCYTQPTTTPPPENVSLKQFWSGSGPLPQIDGRIPTLHIPALLIKKQGDFPPFWQRDNSFIKAMEVIYDKVCAKYRESL